MSSLSANKSIPVLTPEQQGAFLGLVRDNLPAWLLSASAELRRELHESLIASHRSKAEAANLLRNFKSPESFCAPLLAKAMSDKLGAPLDVKGVIFQHVRSTSSLLGLRKKLVLPIDRDLLTAACENFESSETLEENYHDSSLIYIPEKVTGEKNRILSIKPHEFATLCRSLDLGKQYQTHIQLLFESTSETNELRDKCVAHAQNCFETDRHVALMKKHISVEVHQMLKTVKNNEQPVKLGNNTLGFQGLTLFGVMVCGAMFIGPVSEHDDDDYRCVIYLPGDPLHPLKEYVSFTEFERELSARLKVAGFREFFMRYINLGDRARLLETFDARLFRRTSSPPLPLITSYMSLSGVDFNGDPFTEMFHQRSRQTMADARLLVIPTDDEDEKTRLARLETYKTIGLNLALFAASFLPVVGEILLVVTGAQLLVQVYEGIASWSRGEQEQAMDYLFDTLENLILMAAFAAGTVAAGSAYRTVRSSAFIKSLRTVSLTDSRTRLWKPDLAIYRQSRPLPSGSVPDERGLHWVGDRAYLPVNTKLYAVQPKAETDLWEVLRPNGSDGEYLPLLETNGRGAWRHDSELPQEWDRLKLFRRFGYTHEDLSDTVATQILAASGIEDDVLRQAHIDRRSPPALLIDTVRRFRADAWVTRFIEHTNTPSAASLADHDLQLHLLTALKNWPADTAVSVVNAAGEQQSFYGSSTAEAAKTLKLSQNSLDNGQLHTALLSALGRNQREKLVGLKNADQAVEVKELTRILAQEAQRKRLTLFTRIYQRTETPANTRSAVLQEKFVGLPASVAEELVRNALVGELKELDAAQVPLRLAEEARRYLQVIRIARAYEGLYLNAIENLDTDRLVLHALEYLPGWSGNLQVQILEWASGKEGVASIGAASAAEKLIINAHGDRYSVFDGKDGPVTSFLDRTREHYFQALWHGLPAARRTALGVQADDAGAALRQKITQLAQQRRDTITQYLGAAGQPGYRSPMGLADRSVAAPSIGPSGTTAVVSQSDVLVRRAQELYPMHSLAQIHKLLTTLGTDEILVLKKLESLRLEFSAIREALDRWVNRKTWHQAPDGPRQQVSKLSKFRAAQAIIRSWRKESGIVQTSDGLYNALTFAPQPLGELPVITGDFSFIGSLVMEGVGASAGLNAFLHNFSNLQSLSLSGNHLTRLPLAVTSMPRLAHLDLSDNQIQLTTDSVTQLADMTGLRTLTLAYNPNLSRVPDVSRLLHLQQLNLRGTGIDQWPTSASGLANLRLLDVRDNQIEQLPEAFFNDALALNRETRFHGNPLSPDTLKKIVAYQQKNGISLGVITSDYRRQSPSTVTQETQSALWLVGKSLAESEPRRALWDSLLACPGSRDFFNVLARMRDTADFKRLYPQFSQRMWDVLEAAGEDERLRRSLFSIARTGRTSADGYSALFSEMEVQVLCFRAMAAATTGLASLERQLINLLRGLFRLQEVEGLALADINTRSGSQPKLYGHALEISLAYRVGLAERLDLPAQPREMVVKLDVEVTPATLDKACQAVLKTERTSALREWIATQRFWIEYLEAAHRDRFTAISDRTGRDFAQLNEQVELSREAATRRMNAIVDNFRNDRRELIKQLTSQALVRNPAPEVPGTSVSGAAQ